MKLTNDYIRGLVDGEGCFTFHTRDTYGKLTGLKEKMPAFAISMNVRDKELIESVRDHLGLKNRVYQFKPYRGDGFFRDDKVTLVVREIGSLKNIIVPFFYKKLKGYKAKQFEEWMEKMGNDPAVAEGYRFIYRIYKSGFYDREVNRKFI